MLVVDFKVRDMHTVSRVWFWLVLDTCKERLTSPGYQPWLLWSAHHGIRFARAGLTVCEDAGVEAIEIMIQELFAK